MTNQRIEDFIAKYRGHLTSTQISAIHNGLELTARLEKYTQQALGLRPEIVETKRNTYIWSPPGAGKTFAVRNTALQANLKTIDFHGNASLSGFVNGMAKLMYRLKDATVVPIWIDDCDIFFSDKTGLDFFKIVLDNDQPAISWSKNINILLGAAKKNDPVLHEALSYWGGEQGIYIPLNNCRFIITSNKDLAVRADIGKKKTSIDEHAVRDRVSYRSFNITNDQAWGWTASTVITTNVFKDNGFELTPDQLMLLLNTFYFNWKNLTANSMRTVKEAGALLYDNPDSFADEFKQHFVMNERF